MALPERVQTVKKEIYQAVEKLEEKVKEFENLRAMMNDVDQSLRKPQSLDKK